MRFLKDNIGRDRGASMVEYGLLVAVIALVALSAVTLLGDKTDETFTTIAGSLEDNGSALAPGNSGNESDQNGGDQNGGDQNGQQGENDDDEGADGGSNDDANGGDQDQDQDQEAEEEEEEAEAQPAGPNATGTSSALYWWDSNATKGQWKADVSYRNDTNRHQYLTLEVTQIDDKGKTTKSTVTGFYVGAGSSSTYTLWSNDINKNNKNVKGVVEVQVKVLSVLTSDENWQTYSYPVNGSPASILPPALP